jgi:hypothetical protein
VRALAKLLGVEHLLLLVRGVTWWRRTKPIQKFKHVRQVRRELRNMRKPWKTFVGIAVAAASGTLGITEAEAAVLSQQISDWVALTGVLGGSLFALYGRLDALWEARKLAKAAK